ncbi:unnamed protein product [Auanema sp. JU1783]|nr:unnamed protein product [Auanema sp. JU1783]
MREPVVPKMQRFLHQRVTQLRIVPPELKPQSRDDDSPRPRVNSSPSEMKERRLRSSVRREQYYGSVELVVSVDPRGRIRNIGRFRLEPSSDFQPDAPMPTSSSSIVVENPQEEMRWYWKYFLGNEHQNFSGIDPTTKSPFFLSIMVEEEIDDNKLCRAILWTQKGPRRLCVPVSHGGKALTAKAILQRFPEMSDYARQLKEVTNPKIQKELVVLEDQEGSVNCKVGVIFALDDQISDAQMFGNEHGNNHFERFLKILGHRIELQDWGNYRGGLDTTTNSTGRESVYTAFAGHEIMFHVSTMLPYSRENDQQIERKRHVGNDIVNIVFESTDDPQHPSFSPTMMKSHFTHVFAVITYEAPTHLWRLWVYSEESVPPFGPSIPNPNVFSDTAVFREFLLTKLINAEKAAFNAKVFVEKRHRTNDTLLKDMYMEYMKDCQKGINKMTDTVIRHLRSPIRREAPRETVDFCKLGELIKLEKMLSGDVSDSVKMTSICRKQPWEKEIMIRNIPSYDILASDIWKGVGLLISSEEQGVVFVSEDRAIPLFDKDVRIYQMSVLDHFGLFIARMDKGKDSSLIVLALPELRNALQTGNTIKRKICQMAKIPGTKGCHFFAPSDESSLRLNIVACVGKKLLLLRWTIGPIVRYSGVFLINNFTMLTSHQLPEEPVNICVYEKGSYHRVVKVIALAKNHIYIVNLTEGTEDMITCDLPKTEKSHIRTASDGDSDEFILLQQNQTLHYDQQDGEWVPEKTFWSTSLNNFCFRFPFIIGFGEDLIEIRLAVNGNLLASMYMPSVRLLSDKNDIVFSVERPFSSALPTNRGSLIRKKDCENKSRWDVYRFKHQELVSVAKDRDGSRPGGQTPNIIRKEPAGQLISDSESPTYLDSNDNTGFGSESSVEANPESGFISRDVSNKSSDEFEQEEYHL